MKARIILMVFVGALSVFANDAFSQAKSNVRFPPGSTGTSVKGVVRGFEYRDYVVKASEGQTMAVSIDATSSSTVFSIFAANGEVLDGASQTDSYDGVLPSTGNYAIRVAMMRNQARRKGSVSRFTLSVSIK